MPEHDSKRDLQYSTVELPFSMEKAQEGIITFATYKNCTRICMTSSSSRLGFHTHLAPQYQKSMNTYQLRPRKVSGPLKILQKIAENKAGSVISRELSGLVSQGVYKKEMKKKTRIINCTAYAGFATTANLAIRDAKKLPKQFLNYFSGSLRGRRRGGKVPIE